jgi:hypothetical protein
LEDGDKEWPSAFPKIMLKQTDSGIQQLHGAGERVSRTGLPPWVFDGKAFARPRMKDTDWR